MSSLLKANLKNASLSSPCSKKIACVHLQKGIYFVPLIDGFRPIKINWLAVRIKMEPIRLE